MYADSVQIPLFAAVEGMGQGRCYTPVSLLDLAETIPAVFGLSWPGASLQKIVGAAEDLDREAISQYHAAGSVSGSFMLRKGRWKYVEYIGFAPELFDLFEDPQELRDVAGANPQVFAKMAKALREHLDPEATGAGTFADQDALIAHFGGLEAAAQLGAPGATPTSKTD